MALALFALGCVCLHELYGLLRPRRPGQPRRLPRAARRCWLAALLRQPVPGPAGGGRGAAGAVRADALGPEPRARLAAAMATTLLGIYWIGFAIAHAVLLRELPHGDAIVVDVLVGTFVGDTGAYFGGRAFGRRPLAPRISPNKTVEGLADRNADGDRRGLVRRPLPGLAVDDRRADPRPRRRARRPDRRPVRVVHQARRRHEGHRPRVRRPRRRARPRSTRPSSRPSSATTSGTHWLSVHLCTGYR